jgi:hypothetical protein
VLYKVPLYLDLDKRTTTMKRSAIRNYILERDDELMEVLPEVAGALGAAAPSFANMGTDLGGLVTQKAIRNMGTGLAASTAPAVTTAANLGIGAAPVVAPPMNSIPGITGLQASNIGRQVVQAAPQPGAFVNQGVQKAAGSNAVKQLSTKAAAPATTSVPKVSTTPTTNTGVQKLANQQQVQKMSTQGTKVAGKKAATTTAANTAQTSQYGPYASGYQAPPVQVQPQTNPATVMGPAEQTTGQAFTSAGKQIGQSVSQTARGAANRVAKFASDHPGITTAIAAPVAYKGAKKVVNTVRGE